ncbi:cobyrinate a,c-diamide synthase [Zhongshania sp.]|jgi:cobyrinic acid a,c-diamide synthase|uniref:cobyrinate a,c-diamide synthase n=1 Tax=Zhongshania sp. TaxID=1971902 RepID=UPI002A83552D|nr:cobyrinate a,c-diamide synthase [Zhongshania sp.]
MPGDILCPAVFLAAPASGQGKTTITAAIARYHRLQGREVRIFKMGPDYLDPQILEQASGHPVAQLDLWMAGEAYCRDQFYRAAQTADLILVEGAMGMFDGDPSSADLARTFGIPIVLVMDVKGMAQTAAALACGLANYRDDVEVTGLIANHCASERHRQLIADALPASLPLLASFANTPTIRLPERHLGLVQACEVREELETCFNAAAELVGASSLANLPPPVRFSAQSIAPPPRLLAGVRIAIARDEAFSFIYPANTQLLTAMGADLQFFSPIHDTKLPAADALWLPGGYPELHADALTANTAMHGEMQQFYASGKGILAECGGFMYCLESLKDLAGTRHTMLALLAGQAAMRGRGGCQGMQSAVLPEGELRAHAHHRSQSENTPEPIGYGRRPKHPAPGESIYRQRGLTASYLHLFFPSAPEVIAKVFLPHTQIKDADRVRD